ncbi:MAG: flippase-like domain-containing protein [Xanthobacteraceae bacterium]|nr:flippase-like domain-containing protein [Xanthobacteraceae bacterium]
MTDFNRTRPLVRPSAMEAMSRPRASVGKIAVVVLKLGVTVVCFWYVARQVDFAVFAKTLPTINVAWIALAVLGAMLQVPLIGLRWATILGALPVHRVSLLDAVAITWIGAFAGQVLPYGAGDAMRVWLLHRTGPDWRVGLISILIDRGVGVAALFAYGFFILLMPSALIAMEGYRSAIVAVFGLISLGVVLGLAVVPWIAPVLARSRYTRWAGTVASACHAVLVRSRSGFWIVALAFAIHTITILCIWCVGRSVGIVLPVLDAAVLFVLMLGIALLPISIGGWGLREAAVVTLLGAHGVSPEAALSLSVTFGLVLIAGSLPGAMIWTLYSPGQRAAAKEI